MKNSAPRSAKSDVSTRSRVKATAIAENRRPGTGTLQAIEDSRLFEQPTNRPEQGQQELQQLSREVLRQWLELNRAWCTLAREASSDPGRWTRRLDELENRINEAADEYIRLREQLL